MLKRKSSKLMSGTGAVAIVASLGSMSTAAENVSKKIIGKGLGSYAGLFGMYPLARYVGKNVKDMVLNSYKGAQANLLGTIGFVISAVCVYALGMKLGEKIGETVGEYIDEKKEKQDSKIKK